MAPDKLAPAPTFPVKPLFGIITDPCVKFVVTSNIYIMKEGGERYSWNANINTNTKKYS